MKYNFQTYSKAIVPCQVIDASGKHWTHVIEVDTDTGVMLRYQTDQIGNVIPSENFDLLTELIKVPAPVTVE